MVFLYHSVLSLDRLPEQHEVVISFLYVYGTLSFFLCFFLDFFLDLPLTETLTRHNHLEARMKP